MEVRRMKGRHQLCSLCILSACLLSQAPSDANQPEAVPSRVKCSSSPTEGFVVLELEELWYADSEDEEYLFGLIVDAAADQDGNVYLLDRQLADAKVFSADGQYLKTLSRRGEGPGETQQPRGLSISDDGVVEIFQDFPPKYVWIDQIGRPVESVQLDLHGSGGPAVGNLRWAVVKNGRFFASWSVLRLMHDKMHEVSILASFDSKGQQLVQYYTDTRPIGSAPNPDCDYLSFRPGGWDVDSAGRVYALRECGPYAVTVYDSTGSECAAFECEHQRRRRSEEELRRIEIIYRKTEGIPRNADVRMNPDAPALVSVRVAGNGEVWILPDQDPADQARGVLATYDILTPAGDLVRKVQVAGDRDYSRDSWHWISSERLIVVRGYRTMYASYIASTELQTMDESATDDMEIVCYSVRENP